MTPAIAIIDDCGELRKLMALVFEGEGLSSLSLASMAEVRRHSDQVLGSRAVILDINLGPGQPDGIAVYEWLRANEYPGSVFFLTGHAKNSPRVVEAAATGVPILEKPMALEEFLPVIFRSLHGAEPRTQ